VHESTYVLCFVHDYQPTHVELATETNLPFGAVRLHDLFEETQLIPELASRLKPYQMKKRCNKQGRREIEREAQE